MGDGKKLTNPNRIWKNMLGEKSQRWSNDCLEKNTERRTLDDTSRAGCLFEGHLTKGLWNLMGRRAIWMSLRSTTSVTIPSSKTGKLWSSMSICGGWAAALRCLLLMFKPPSFWKANPIRRLSSCASCGEKWAVLKMLHQRISSKTLRIRVDTVVVIRVRIFINLKFRAAFSFLNPDHKHFYKYDVSSHAT